MATFQETLKEHANALMSICGLVAAIAGGIFYIQNNYASATEIRTVSQNQEMQLKALTTQQRQLALFQLEFYDDKLRKLQEEKRIAEERERTRSVSRAIQKTPSEIQEEINDIKQRRELVRKILQQ